MSLALDPRSAHVWYLDPRLVEDPAIARSCEAMLHHDERERQARLTVPRVAVEHLATRALARATLSRYADVAPSEWTFRRNRWGRPEIAGPAGAPPLRFNLSNTRGLVACVVTLERECGIDVEWIHRLSATEAVASRFFAPSEVAALLALPEEERRHAFFRYWTLKEAYIKARGMGLAIPLGAFAFRLDPAVVRVAFDERIDDDPSSWQFAELRPTERHRMALAIRRRGEPELSLIVREARAIPG